MKKFVYLAPPIARPMVAPLEEQGFETALGDGTYSDEMLEKCWALVPNREPVSDAVLDKAPNLRLICKKGVGIDRIDLEACTRRGICVANTPLSNYISVAEHTIALLMASAKQVYPISVSTRCGEPDRKCVMKYAPTEINGKTLSIIGLGNIGTATAKMALGLGMKVLAYVRHPEKTAAPDGIELTNSMDEALRRGNFVSLHVSGSEANRHLIGRRELEEMKPTAVLINTTRGFVVDEKALFDALVDKVIAGAALDVFEKEPVQGDNPLLSLMNVVATPHCAGYTKEANLRGYMDCVDIISAYAKGVYPATAVNKVPPRD